MDVPRIRGGGLTHINSDLLLATGEGKFYWIDLSKDSEKPPVTELVINFPINLNDFGEKIGWQPFHIHFKLLDVLAVEQGDGNYNLYVSYHFWNIEEDCFSIRVSKTDITQDGLLSGKPGSWELLFETSPCQELYETEDIGTQFQEGIRSGGRMLQLDENHIILSTGDHGYDGVNAETIVSQDLNSSLGKTIKINTDSGASEFYTIGNRNPQGLFLSKSGIIWETEHGPEGGDEINILEESKNYGWPNATYGTDYGTTEWPLVNIQGKHDGYPRPIYTFVPSIGISNLIEVEKDLFPFWKGDLLVGSLVGNLLHRVRVEEGRVIFAEPIELGHRLRDIIEIQDGRIVMWTDEGTLITLEPSESAYNFPPSFVACTACHTTYENGPERIGPNLWGIIGKQIASSTEFKYSNAFSEQLGYWNRESLNQLLESPIDFAPGTLMVTPGIIDPGKRDEIITFLESLN